MLHFTTIHEALFMSAHGQKCSLTHSGSNTQNNYNLFFKSKNQLTCDAAVVATVLGDCGRVPWVAPPAGCPGNGGNPLYIGGKNGIGGNMGAPCPLLPGGGIIPGGRTMPGGGVMKGGG